MWESVWRVGGRPIARLQHERAPARELVLGVRDDAHQLLPLLRLIAQEGAKGQVAAVLVVELAGGMGMGGAGGEGGCGRRCCALVRSSPSPFQIIASIFDLSPYV